MITRINIFRMLQKMSVRHNLNDELNKEDAEMVAEDACNATWLVNLMQEQML
ncbi:MAG: hypothetical protein ACLUR5_14655 [Eubacterium ventriosum]